MERLKAIQCRIPAGVAEIDVLIPVTYRLADIEPKNTGLVIHNQPAVLKKAAADECYVGSALNSERSDGVGFEGEDGAIAKWNQDRAIVGMSIEHASDTGDR